MSPTNIKREVAKPKARNLDEQRLWDDIVRSIIAFGRDATLATKEADLIIAQRRQQGGAK